VVVGDAAGQSRTWGVRGCHTDSHYCRIGNFGCGGVRVLGVGVAERSAAFAVLVDRFQDMAFGYAKSILGDTHLAQESFLMAYAGLRQLREFKAFA